MSTVYPCCSKPLFGPIDSRTGIKPYLKNANYKIFNMHNTCKHYERFVWLFRIIATPPKGKKKLCKDCLWFRFHEPLRRI